MSSLTDTAENRVLDWITGNTVTAPTAPLKCRLMTANGSDSAAGTEVAGGTYTPQNYGGAVASSGATTNSAIIRFDGMPACTVTGVEIWDSNGTPVRWLHGALTSSIAVLAGESLEFAAGELDLTAA